MLSVWNNGLFNISGPLTYNNGGRATLVGVVSYGKAGCWSYTVFARVTAVLPWIQDEMEQQCQ